MPVRAFTSLVSALTGSLTIKLSPLKLGKLSDFVQQLSLSHSILLYRELFHGGIFFLSASVLANIL